MTEPTAADRPCPHENFAAYADVARELASDDNPELVGLTVELTVRCIDCDTPLVFFCADAGMLRDRPAISLDGTEIRLPARAQDHPESFGLNLPGFGINVWSSQ